TTDLNHIYTASTIASTTTTVISPIAEAAAKASWNKPDINDHLSADERKDYQIQWKMDETYDSDDSDDGDDGEDSEDSEYDEDSEDSEDSEEDDEDDEDDKDGENIQNSEIYSQIKEISECLDVQLSELDSENNIE
ncbi:11084_t:CDS:2, partial [Rhizophagus irregularis]